MDKKLNRQRWLNAGLQEVAERGAGELRIMRLAQRLRVTKGSFYWHFKDLAGYQASLLEEWESSRTALVIEQTETNSSTATERLRALLTTTLGSDARLAQAMRVWANSDAGVGEAVARVDRKRLAYLSGLLREVGWPRADAVTLAHWGYCALLGHFSLGAPRLTKRQLALVLSRFERR